MVDGTFIPEITSKSTPTIDEAETTAIVSVEVTEKSLITDLTGTTLIFNDVVYGSSNLDSNVDFRINFSFETDDGIIECSRLSLLVNVDEDTPVYVVYWRTILTPEGYEIYAFDIDNGWANENYKKITITGGTDATNSDCFIWVQENGTLQTNITPEYVETVFQGTGTLSSKIIELCGKFDIVEDNIGLTETEFNNDFYYHSTGQLPLDGLIYIKGRDDEGGFVLVYHNNTWEFLPFSIIDLSSSGIATLSVNMSNLSENDVYVLFTVNEPQYTTTYTITANILNGTASSSNPTSVEYGGTATLTFTANDGYELPDSVSFYGADYTWDKSTGTLTISNPTDNINCVITCSQIISYPKINSFTYKGKQIRYINEKPIRYVHYNGNTYEMVYATFIEPTVTGSKITIEQAYSATQDGNTLIIE